MPGTATTTANQTLMNASSGVSSGFADTSGLAPMVVILLYVVGALVAAQFVAPWLAKSGLLSTVGGGFVKSLQLAVKGFAATAVLALGALPVYFLATADGSTRGLALEALAAGVGIYIALTVIGMLADRAVTAFIDAHPEYDEWGDIWREEEPDREAVADGGEEPEGGVMQ